MWQQAEATEDSSEAGCSIWHVDVDALPEWILTSVHQVSVSVRQKVSCNHSGLNDVMRGREVRRGGAFIYSHSVAVIKIQISLFTEVKLRLSLICVFWFAVVHCIRHFELSNKNAYLYI